MWLDEDHSQSKVFGAVVVKAGARDCPGTGIAHYFEHMMFKGTDKIGTINYEAEKPLLDAIARKYDLLARTHDNARCKALQQEINELSVQAAAYAVPNEFERLITCYGGNKLNAGTSYDFTVYYNTFSPQYLAHWAEINSERLLTPVFRLFQSELETVYEEKNMYNDSVGAQALEKLTEKYFSPHPYAYPIIGSTEHLKKPRLLQMQQFFRDYYVASNMGVILCGDFNAGTALPVLEKAFSRIRRGEAPRREPVSLPPFRGKEKFRVKVPVPLVKVLALAFRGLPAGHPDRGALTIALGLLNNANGTGYLDKLSVEGKVMGIMSMNESLNEAGMLGIVVVPKLMFQSYSAAEKLVWNEIGRIKRGDFTDEQFQALLLEEKRKYETTLEDIHSRSDVLMRLFSQGKTWKSYLQEIERLKKLTRNDIIRAASVYFGPNYLYVTKKLGRYKKDRLPEPGFKPVKGSRAETGSAYARRLASLPVKEMRPRFLDFGADVYTVSLSLGNRLYVARNPVNRIFSFDLAYAAGVLGNALLEPLASYLACLGTRSQPYDVFRNRLQTLGSTLTFEAENDRFIIRTTGFDEHFDATLQLLDDFLSNVMPEKKKLKQLIGEEKINGKAFFKSGDQVAEALLERVKYGDRSRYLTRLSYGETKKLRAEQLIHAFHEIQQRECRFHYCGTYSAQEAARRIETCLPFSAGSGAGRPSGFRAPLKPDEPAVYFYDLPGLSQNIVYAYLAGDPPGDLFSRHTAKVFSAYFGGGMSSLMFQEIREFRSLAYRVQADYELPPPRRMQEAACFQAMLSTQADKTTGAIEVLETLFRRLPVKPERLQAVKQTIINKIHNNYPSFREISGQIARLQAEGYENDPHRALVDDLPRIGMDAVVRFHEENICKQPRVYLVVGDSGKTDLKKLENYGPLKMMKNKDLYKS